MKKTLAIGIFAATAFARAASAHTLYALDADGVNIRQGPGTGHRVIAALGPGEGVAVLGKEFNWYKVRLRDGTVGYAAAWVSRVLYDDEEQTAVVDTDVLNVRTGPELGAAVLGTVRQGDRLRLREVRGDWWRVDYQGGNGWVAGQYMREEAPPPPPSAPAPPPSPPPARRPTAGKAVALAVPRAPVLRGRDPEYDPVDTVAAGEALTYLDAAQGWVQVETPRGARGWLPGPQVTLWEGAPGAGAAYRLAEGRWQIFFPPARQVTPAEGLRLRQGPDLATPTLMVLPRGALVQVLQDGGTWLQVAAEGATGWVAAEFTAPAAAPAAPRLQAATLQAPAPGVLRLELTGRLAGAAVRRSGKYLLIALADTAGGRRATLRVADAGAGELAVDALGVSLSLEGQPDVQVLEQTDSRLLLELRPVLRGVGLRFEDGNAIYRLGVDGYVRPGLEVAGGGRDVVVSLPGARLATHELPPYLRAEAGDGGVRLHIPSVRSYAVKRVAGGLDVLFYRPGLAGKRILLDPGHGGPEPGAVGAGGLAEKDVNLDVALRLQPLLEKLGARVTLTRSGDTRALPGDRAAFLPEGDLPRADLEWRARLANDQQVDVFLSIHSNSGTGNMSGTETYYSSGNLNAGRSQALARAVQAEVVRALGRRDRGVREAIYYVVRYADAPAALAELAFLSHPEEGRLLAAAAFRQQAAQALAGALQRFFDERPANGG